VVVVVGGGGGGRTASWFAYLRGISPCSYVYPASYVNDNIRQWNGSFNRQFEKSYTQ